MNDSDIEIAIQIGERLDEAKMLLDVRGVPNDHPRLKELADQINKLYEGLSPEAKRQNDAAKFIEGTPLHAIGGAI